MKTEIYTIPIQDAFAEESECPVCRMYQKLEENAINYTIGPGASYMEGDIREQSDEQGFCQKHLGMLYEYPNKLGLAMMLKTHMDKTAKELKKAMKAASGGRTFQETEPASPSGDYLCGRKREKVFCV